METLNYHGEKHTFLNDLIREHGMIYVGCRTTGDFLKKHGLVDGEQYIYVRFDKSVGKWRHSDGSSCKYDKVLIKMSLFEETFDELDLIKTPDILELKEEEMFKDDEGNVIDIEVRGERDVDRCYFKVEDVSNGFDLPNLQITITNNDSAYEKKRHYVYFMVDDITAQKTMKKMYLTYEGLKKIAIRSHKISEDTANEIYRWLEHITNVKTGKDFVLNKMKRQQLNRSGYVYCITSEILNAIKIGFYRSTIKSLKSRYTTCYGSQLIVHAIMTDDCIQLESEIHERFAKYCIINELFKKEHLDSYVNYLVNNAINKVTEPEHYIEE